MLLSYSVHFLVCSHCLITCRGRLLLLSSHMAFLNSVNGTNSSPALLGETNLLQQGQTFLHRYGAILEVLIMMPLYWPFLNNTLIYLRGFPSSKKGAIQGYPPKILTLHILVGFIITIRYYAKNFFTAPTAERLDLALGIVQLSSAWLLTKWTPTKSTLSKAFFQTMAILFIIPLTMAIATGSPQWHRTFVKCVEWFVPYRWVGLAIRKYHVFGHPKVPATAIVHMVSIPATLWLADWMGGIPFYLGTAPSVMLLDQWVTRQAPHRYVDSGSGFVVGMPISLIVM